MSTINIYKASAGSGKTYTLTGKYINLLFQDPNNFRQILAVTFTNKATDEMKSRILKEIYYLANNKKSGYKEELLERYKYSEETLQKKAEELLFSILHKYSWFSVTTIDSFFQKIIRAFANETGLQAGFDLELDLTRVINNVTDNLLKSLSKNKELKKWISDYSQNSIEGGKSWMLNSSIAKLAQEVFKEDYKQFDNILIEKLKDKNFLNNYKNELRESAQDFEKNMQSFGKKALTILGEKELSIEDFPYKKSSFANYFNKIYSSLEFEPTTRAKAALDNKDKWTSKSTDNDVQVKIDYAYNDLNKILKDSIDFYEANYYRYNSISIILKNIHTLGILTDISKQIKEFTKKENIFLISDASQLLNIIIGENEAPFIYEKIGNTYKHFMIDEFQDTSNMQWANFKPLVGNSLANDDYSLIVGDVKQSIYRWRGGDWDLLENKIEDEFKHIGCNTQTLQNNWRSKANVIKYNNSIFYYCPLILQKYFNSDMLENQQDELKEEQELIVKAYSSAYQEIPEGKINNQGSVKHIFLENEKEYTWEEKVLDQIPLEIKKLQDEGYKASNIAVLIRKAKEGKMIADKLMECGKLEENQHYNFNFISNDSLFLKNCSAIKLIVNIFKLLLNPNDNICKTSIIYEYNHYLHDNEDSVYELDESIKEILTEDLESLKRMPLYELSEKLINKFNLNANKEFFPYLLSFQDLVADFCTQKGSDISLFLDWWEEQKDKRYISVAEQQDAIKILTIHKSKGLEFKAVIIPFCSWELDPTKPERTIWCKPDDDKLNAIDILPVVYSKKLASSVFCRDYYKEKLKTYIDNLNLLYVAFTRAEEKLISFSPKPSDKKGKDAKPFNRIGDLLYFVYNNGDAYPKAKNGTQYINISGNWDSEKFSLILEGDKILRKDTEKEDLDKSLTLSVYTSVCLNDRLQLKYHSEDYFDFEEKDNINEYSPISKGNLLHEVFQNISYLEDVEIAINKLIVEGKISNKQALQLKYEFDKLFNDDQIKDWFSKKWEIISERDIICKNNDIYRPDRVMINGTDAIVVDYKTGSERPSSHKRQVKHYCSLLKQMNYTNVKGYLWYLKDNTIEEAK